MKALLYLLLLAVLTVGRTLAQTRDLASMTYMVSTLRQNDTVAMANFLEVKFKVPIWNKGRHVAAATLSYKNLSLVNFSDLYSSPLHGLSAQVAWLYKFTPKRSLTLLTQAGLFSDMKDLTGNDFRYSAGFRYRVKHSEKLSSGWGLAYSRQFFGNQIVPFIDVDYKPNQKWSLTGQFPIKPKILYQFTEKLSAGIEIHGDAASYRLSATERNNQFIQINQWAGMAKLEYQFSQSWLLTMGMGGNFKQSYKLYDQSEKQSWTIITLPIGERPNPIYEVNSPGLHVQVGISFIPF